jgi:hypothetical protein
LRLRRHSAEIAQVVGGVNVDHRLDRIMRHDGVGGGAADLRHAAKHLRRLRLAGRHAGEIVERIHPILRRLGDHRVRNAVSRIEPEYGIGLDRTGKGNLQAGGDVAFADAKPARLDAVDVDADGRRVARLLDARIGDAGNLRDPP